MTTNSPQPRATALHPRALIALLAALAMLGALGIDAYLPALPEIGHEYKVTPEAVQQSLTIFIFGYAFMLLFYGTLSDSFGRRPVILLAQGGYVLGALGCAVAPSFGWLMFFRLLQGLSAGAGNVVGRALVADLFSGAEMSRMLAFIQMVFGIAPVLAPIIGGWLQAGFGWRYIFYAVVGFSVVVLAFSLRLLPESLVPEKRHAFHLRVVLANYWDVGGHVPFVLMSVGNSLTFVGTSIYIGAAPELIYSILHLGPHDFGWLFVPLIGGMTLGSVLTAHLSHRIAPHQMIRLGYAVMLVSAVGNVVYSALFTAAVPWVMIAPFFYCVGMSTAGPAMNMTMMNLFPRTRGLAASLTAFVFMALFAVVSGVVCPLVFDSALHLALAILAGLVLSLVFWWLGAPKHTSDAGPELMEAPVDIPSDL